ncbi:hypothetical protein FRX31_002909 [Thalictrum thalictroides]|uniref:Uncharacterized protein n=1 Tax=Thalictrum thalictroides TaxID=46969 RepID=A0A7J6XCP8_THATH|nr:hypothetical protein FRX31_002909 [Thalictrum thalictroides]
MTLTHLNIHKKKDLLSSGTAFEQIVNAHKASMTLLDPANNGDSGGPDKVDADKSNESTKLYPITGTVRRKFQPRV